VSLIAIGPNILVCHPSVPATTVKELIALAKRRPGQLTFASAGIGATTHLAGEYFKTSLASMCCISLIKAARRRRSISSADKVSFMVDSMPSALPKVQANKIRALATTGKKRYAALAECTTVVESGLAVRASISWWGLWLGPAGMPQPNRSISSVADVTRVMGATGRKRHTRNRRAPMRRHSTPRSSFCDWVKQATKRQYNEDHQGREHPHRVVRATTPVRFTSKEAGFLASRLSYRHRRRPGPFTDVSFNSTASSGAVKARHKLLVDARGSRIARRRPAIRASLVAKIVAVMADGRPRLSDSVRRC
jgi:hypothetical protein